jgi:hypothetical protein
MSNKSIQDKFSSEYNDSLIQYLCHSITRRLNLFDIALIEVDEFGQAWTFSMLL